LSNNAHRYTEPEPDPEDEPEPEVDLTGFIAKQRAADDQPILYEGDSKAQKDDEEETDDSLIQFTSTFGLAKAESNEKKGNVQRVEWTEEMETMRQEMQAADAMKDLKSRLQGGNVLRNPPNQSHHRQKKEKSPVADRRGEVVQSANSQSEMEAFLDDLLS